MEADFLELALRRLVDNGMSPTDGADMLEHFATGSGRDIPWADIGVKLPDPIACRIDCAAIAWLSIERV